MDMIEQIELEDAVKTREKVDARVLQVALIVGEAKDELSIHNSEKKDYDRKKWKLSRWNIIKGRNREEDKVSATLKIHWFDRPITKEYGDPDEDREDDVFSASGEWLSRGVSFPVSYLTTSNWEADLQKSVDFKRTISASIKVGQLKDHLSNLKIEQKKAEAEGALLNRKEEFWINYGEKLENL